jgi:hypothetical protein
VYCRLKCILLRLCRTLSAECPLLPWTPRVVFTGVSVYTLDSAGQVVKHVDLWDSCGEDELPLLGGLRDILFGGAGCAPHLQDACLPLLDLGARLLTDFRLDAQACGVRSQTQISTCRQA